ncbi:hypothetical protein [Azonexus sp. R2A61]|uniref:hypothetical protein n=1 Tax=Azonexus sp. R2A61 TaxID=2744443 RepID=UPI001F217226|nr:hypothetical protein [Azonexus sp. R2A61]
MATCIKVNSSGAWANLIPMVHPSRLKSALAACEALALATKGDISFKVIKDGETTAVFHKYPRKGAPNNRWYNPAAQVDEGADHA